MSGDLTFPQPMTHADALAWQEYLTSTADARERYAKALDNARDHYERVRQSAAILADAATRQAWELFQEVAQQAWTDYLMDTSDAKRVREVSLGHVSDPLAAP